ncbi:TetR/AcrR family transcriptional regulator [Brevibacillus centrosporus]|jgi:AcrR family transcriptional regulator|uniref:TetR/AcrR family transcriptional regulator n=1 Tax=Brevibacillus TaxID=55080 RepID=UPI00398891FB
MKHDRRKEILIAAREVLAEKGLEATKVSEIVKRAGVAQGTFYLYFPSKNSMIIALAQEMLESVLVAVRRETEGLQTFEDVVSKGISAACYQMGEYRDVYAILNNGGGVVEDPLEWEKLFEPLYNLIEHVLSQWQSVGAVDSLLNPSLAARLIVSMVEQAVEDCYIYRRDISVEDYIVDVTHFVKKALRTR